MGKGYIQPWEPVVPAAQEIEGIGAGRVILQLPDLYGNIISSALDVIIEPDETTDACVRKF